MALLVLGGIGIGYAGGYCFGKVVIAGLTKGGLAAVGAGVGIAAGVGVGVAGTIVANNAY